MPALEIRTHLAGVERAIGGETAALETARHRHKHFRLAAEENQKRIADLQEQATKAPTATRRHSLTVASQKAEHHYLVDHNRSVYWKGKIRTESARLGGLDNSRWTLEKELADYLASHGPQLSKDGLTVHGGALTERLLIAQHAAMHNYAAGTLPGYYSQTGAARAYGFTLNHYPYGHVWDCSTYADGHYIVVDHEAPSGPDTLTAGGYTGTQMAHGKVIAAGAARVGDLVIYLRYAGDTIGHHVEVVLDPKHCVTSGHGDSAINKANGNGSYNLFGDGLFVVRTYHPEAR